MPMPSLNELMTLVQNTGNMDFMGTYQKAQAAEIERQSKQQQIQNLIEEMKLKQEMQPYEIAGKEASTRYNNALAGQQELKTDIDRNVHTPEAIQALSEKPAADLGQTRASTNKTNADAQMTQQMIDPLMRLNEINNRLGMIDYSDPKAAQNAIAALMTESNAALEILKMQQRLKEAQISASATRGATEPRHAQLERLGISLGMKGQRLSDFISEGMARSQAGAMPQQDTLVVNGKPIISKQRDKDYKPAGMEESTASVGITPQQQQILEILKRREAK